MNIRALIVRAATDFVTAAGRKETVQDIIASANIIFGRPQVTGDVLAVQQRDLVWGVRDDGSAVMADLEYSNVTVGEMLRADEEGLLAGNPRHLVIAATGGRGGGVSPQDIWDAFVVVIGLAKYGYEGFEMGRNVAEMRRGLSRRAARKYVVLIVAMRSGYWPVAGRHSLRGEGLRERGNRPDRSGSQQS